jgi:hypothetical protein
MTRLQLFLAPLTADRRPGATTRGVRDTPPLFDTGRTYATRTPRRPDVSGRKGGYAAQLWCEEGYWDLGAHPTTAAARRACRAFAETQPEPPATPEEAPANWVRRRREPEDDSPRWVRRVKGGAYQARYWLEVVGGSLNLGLFTLAEHDNSWELAQWTAARAAKAFRKLWVGTRTVREAVEILQMKRALPADAPKDMRMMRAPWVPPLVTVPAKWADLVLPTDYGEMRYAHEKAAERRRKLDRKLYRLGTLVAMVEERRACAA